MSLGVSFPRQTPVLVFERIGTDARFPYEVRQNVVIGLVVFPLWEQEVPGSNPGAPTRGKAKPDRRLAASGFALVGAGGAL